MVRNVRLHLAPLDPCENLREFREMVEATEYPERGSADDVGAAAAITSISHGDIAAVLRIFTEAQQRGRNTQPEPAAVATADRPLDPAPPAAVVELPHNVIPISGWTRRGRGGAR